MSAPNPLIYAFEDALEQATAAWLLASGLNDPKKQRDDEELLTPRVEVKATFAGFAAHEHYYINQKTGARWLDLTDFGTLYLKIVTRRDDKDQNHSLLRGTCRYLMQHAAELSNRMKFHVIEKIIETASTITIQDDKQHDISALTFSVSLRIRPESFPIA